ncbi:CRISPR-associated endonuclease Cas2 [Nostoc sp. 'Peltigera membranacea cyanobiont' N6]|uniref:CRISPR-associated endonuclease Cas2 n=1 Tax=Nostoc sp. 'Peltigera membranacea cyanobiont' N6 TaxID=1261031 RepID=UPI000CF30653|nr:CRISPR-associated endonuclease Cas2 [Nostoc sp. 'Peltigera membranacea cyanobiont' N6]AVH68247.1 CRISPR-associated endoribonuclease Cas2 [Nostoc sp. 'Peltigera membranacea cyanobiont' N6]
MLVVVVYDIPDDKRRSKLSNFLEGYGQRIQLSVFECFLDLSEMQQLYDDVKKRVKASEDNVRFYWISQEAVNRVLTIGGESPQPPPKYYVI